MHMVKVFYGNKDDPTILAGLCTASGSSSHKVSTCVHIWLSCHILSIHSISGTMSCKFTQRKLLLQFSFNEVSGISTFQQYLIGRQLCHPSWGLTFHPYCTTPIIIYAMQLALTCDAACHCTQPSIVCLPED